MSRNSPGKQSSGQSEHPLPVTLSPRQQETQHPLHVNVSPSQLQPQHPSQASLSPPQLQSQHHLHADVTPTQLQPQHTSNVILSPTQHETQQPLHANVSSAQLQPQVSSYESLSPAQLPSDVNVSPTQTTFQAHSSPTQRQSQPLPGFYFSQASAQHPDNQPQSEYLVDPYGSDLGYRRQLGYQAHVPVSFLLDPSVPPSFYPPPPLPVFYAPQPPHPSQDTVSYPIPHPQGIFGIFSTGFPAGGSSYLGQPSQNAVSYDIHPPSQGILPTSPTGLTTDWWPVRASEDSYLAPPGQNAASYLRPQGAHPTPPTGLPAGSSPYLGHPGHTTASYPIPRPQGVLPTSPTRWPVDWPLQQNVLLHQGQVHPGSADGGPALSSQQLRQMDYHRHLQQCYPQQQQQKQQQKQQQLQQQQPHQEQPYLQEQQQQQVDQPHHQQQEQRPLLGSYSQLMPQSGSGSAHWRHEQRIQQLERELTELKEDRQTHRTMPPHTPSLQYRDQHIATGYFDTLHPGRFTHEEPPDLAFVCVPPHEQPSATDPAYVFQSSQSSEMSPDAKDFVPGAMAQAEVSQSFHSPWATRNRQRSTNRSQLNTQHPQSRAAHYTAKHRPPGSRPSAELVARAKEELHNYASRAMALSSNPEEASQEIETRVLRVPAVFFNEQKFEDKTGYKVLLLPQSPAMRGQEALTRVCFALEHSLQHRGVGATIISDYKFKENYLKHVPRDLADVLASPEDEGSHDVLVVGMEVGVVCVQVTCVETSTNSGTVKKQLRETLKQLEKDVKVVRHVLRDLDLRDRCVHKVMALPNITTRKLKQKLDPAFLKNVASALGTDDDLLDLLTLDCLPGIGLRHWSTRESRDRLNQWMERLAARDSRLHKDDYMQIFARYTGEWSGTEVWGVGKPRVHVRSLAHAVSETFRRHHGDRRLPVLTPQQAHLLRPGHARHVRIDTPPRHAQNVMMNTPYRDVQHGRDTVSPLEHAQRAIDTSHAPRNALDVIDTPSATGHGHPVTIDTSSPSGHTQRVTDTPSGHAEHDTPPGHAQLVTEAPPSRHAQHVMLEAASGTGATRLLQVKVRQELERGRDVLVVVPAELLVLRQQYQDLAAERHGQELNPPARDTAFSSGGEDAGRGDGDVKVVHAARQVGLPVARRLFLTPEMDTGSEDSDVEASQSEAIQKHAEATPANQVAVQAGQMFLWIDKDDSLQSNSGLRSDKTYFSKSDDDTDTDDTDRSVGDELFASVTGDVRSLSSFQGQPTFAAFDRVDRSRLSSRLSRLLGHVCEVVSSVWVVVEPRSGASLRLPREERYQLVQLSPMTRLPTSVQALVKYGLQQGTSRQGLQQGKRGQILEQETSSRGLQEGKSRQGQQPGTSTRDLQPGTHGQTVKQGTSSHSLPEGQLRHDWQHEHTLQQGNNGHDLQHGQSLLQGQPSHRLQEGKLRHDLQHYLQHEKILQQGKPIHSLPEGACGRDSRDTAGPWAVSPDPPTASVWAPRDPQFLSEVSSSLGLATDGPCPLFIWHPVTEPGYHATEPGYPVTEPGYPVTEPDHPVTDPGNPVTEPAHSGSQLLGCGLCVTRLRNVLSHLIPESAPKRSSHNAERSEDSSLPRHDEQQLAPSASEESYVEDVSSPAGTDTTRASSEDYAVPLRDEKELLAPVSTTGHEDDGADTAQASSGEHSILPHEKEELLTKPNATRRNEGYEANLQTSEATQLGTPLNATATEDDDASALEDGEDGLSEGQPPPLTQDMVSDCQPTPLTQDVGSDGQPPPLTQDVLSDGQPKPLTQDVLSDGQPPPLTQDMLSDGQPPPLTQDVLSDDQPPPLTQDVGSYGQPQPLTQDVLSDGQPPPLTQDVGSYGQPQPLTQDVLSDGQPPPLTPDDLLVFADTRAAARAVVRTLSLPGLERVVHALHDLPALVGREAAVVVYVGTLEAPAALSHSHTLMHSLVNKLFDVMALCQGQLILAVEVNVVGLVPGQEGFSGRGGGGGEWLAPFQLETEVMLERAVKQHYSGE